jgi:small subunit ribosomal protein S18
MTASNLDKKPEKKIKGKKRKISPQTDYFLSQGITYIDYKDVATLRKFINRQGRIYPRKYTQLMAKTQRQVTTVIKRSRHMALLPYTIVEQSGETQK